MQTPNSLLEFAQEVWPELDDAPDYLIAILDQIRWHQGVDGWFMPMLGINLGRRGATVEPCSETGLFRWYVFGILDIENPARRGVRTSLQDAMDDAMQELFRAIDKQKSSDWGKP